VPPFHLQKSCGVDEFVIRLAERPEEIDAFRELALEYEALLPPPLRHSDVDFVPESVLVSWSAGIPSGCVALSRLDAETAIMKRLFVRPVYRGHGIARALVATFVDLARQQGSLRVVLDTDREQLAAAYALYHSIGFEECAPYGPVDYATPTFMQLRL
jgi:GNAT superfamily N-acetyltransferase